MLHTHRLMAERPFNLEALPTDGKQFHPNRDEAETEFKALRKEFVQLQRQLYAEGKQKLLIVLQAMDAGGKDGTIRNILKGVNPQGVRVHSFKVPSKEELAHDFLWRIHKAVPAQGMIGVFNRSHYEDVLVVRVHDIVPEAVWRPRYEQINNFEKLLHDTGTRILKFYLHISKDEQKERIVMQMNSHPLCDAQPEPQFAVSLAAGSLPGQQHQQQIHQGQKGVNAHFLGVDDAE